MNRAAVAYSLFAPEDVNSGWVRFEIFEEEVVSVRRLIHVADRREKYIKQVHRRRKEVQPVNIVQPTKETVGLGNLFGFIKR